MKKTKKETVKEQIARYTQRFTHAENAVAEKRRMWQMLDMFDRGEQWKDANLPPWVPKPVTNFVRYIRTLKRANLASSIPMANYTAEYEEDTPDIDRLSRAYKHVWEKERVPRIIRRCVDRALLQGTAIAYVYSDDDVVEGKYYSEGDNRNKLFQGKICVKRIPNANFFPDPDAYTIDDGKFHEYTEILPMSSIINHPAFREYCEKEGTLKKLDALKKTSQLENNSAADGTIYDRDHTPNDTAGSSEGDENATLHVHFERRMVKGGKFQMDITYYLRDTDFFLLRREDVKPNWFYPFAVLYDEEEENDFWGTSTAMDFLENQKIVNKTDQTASIIATMHQNPQKVVSQTSGINGQELARSGTLPGKVWTANGDPTKAIHVVQPADIPKSLPEHSDRVKADIREMAGVNEAYTGQSVGSLTTSTGVNSLIERATIRDKDKMIQIDAFVERLSDLIVMHIMYKWKDERKISYTGPDGKPVHDTYVPIDEDVADNLEWRCKVDIYAKAPTTLASRRQQADQLMQMQGQFQFEVPVITPEEWIQFQDFDMKEQILRRMQADRQRLEQQKPEKMMQQITQAAMQMNQLIAQGLAPQEAASQMAQMVQQMFQQEQQKAVQQGSAPKTPQAPQGTTGALAMNAMARGM